tara:strand:+ start:1173 stop:1934 length:762 start_codon:yes stop_codon:yes gene_type:complete
MREFVIIILLMMTLEACNQKPFARILATKGDNSILNSTRDIGVGDYLYSNDTVVLAEDGYMGLILSSGATFELFDPGIVALEPYFVNPYYKSRNPCQNVNRPYQTSKSILSHCSKEYEVSLEGNYRDDLIDIYPTTIRLNFKVPTTIDSISVTLLNRCIEKLDSSTFFENFLDLKISTMDLTTLYDGLIFFSVSGYNSGKEYKCNLYGMQIVNEERIEEIENALDPIRGNEQLRLFYSGNNLPLNAAYLQNQN